MWFTRVQMAAIYCKESVVRGHHVYKHVWTPAIGEVLPTKKERGNVSDPRAVAITKPDGHGTVVGHVPRELSRVAWHFITHGGSISCEITGQRQRDANPRLGLVVPCLYKFEGKEKMVVRLREVLEKKKHARK